MDENTDENTVTNDETNPSNETVIPSTSDDKFNINEMVANQLKAFQDNFTNQLNADYGEKLKKLQEDTTELEKKKKRLTVIEELKDSGLDANLVDFVYDDNPGITTLKIKQLKDLIAAEIEKAVTQKMKTNAYVPGGSSTGMNLNSSKDKPKYFV